MAGWPEQSHPLLGRDEPEPQMRSEGPSGTWQGAGRSGKKPGWLSVTRKAGARGHEGCWPDS